MKIEFDEHDVPRAVEALDRLAAAGVLYKHDSGWPRKEEGPFYYGPSGFTGGYAVHAVAVARDGGVEFRPFRKMTFEQTLEMIVRNHHESCEAAARLAAQAT